MIQSGEVVRDIPFFRNILSIGANKETDIARSLGKDFLDKQIDKFSKKYLTVEGSGITLTNNETKDTMKVIKSLENRGIMHVFCWVL